LLGDFLKLAVRQNVERRRDSPAAILDDFLKLGFGEIAAVEFDVDFSAQIIVPKVNRAFKLSVDFERFKSAGRRIP